MVGRANVGGMQSFGDTAMANAINWSSMLRLPGLTTTACGLACLAADVTFAKDPCLVYRPREYSRSARHSMNHALEWQAAEARVLSQTMWNHHFEQDSSELRAAGRAHLDRLARRYPFGNFELSVQSAHDFQFTDDDHDAYFSHRRELDTLRTKAVADYLQRVIPGNQMAIQIHDKPPVGINGGEAIRAFNQMVNQANVFVPDDSNGPRFMFGFGETNGGGMGGPGMGGFGPMSGPSMGGPGMGGPGMGGPGSMPPMIGGQGSPDPSQPSFAPNTPTGQSSSPSGPNPNP